jgi:hypothetical protein
VYNFKIGDCDYIFNFDFNRHIRYPYYMTTESTETISSFSFRWLWFNAYGLRYKQRKV